MFGAVSLLSSKLMTLMKSSSALVIVFGLVWSRFLMSHNGKIHCRTGNVYFWYEIRKTPSNQFFLKSLVILCISK